LKEHSTEVDALYNKIIELESRIEGQEQYSRRTSLRFHNIKVPVDSGWFFKPFLLLYTLLRVLYEMILTITWDFPSFTFPIICDLPISYKLINNRDDILDFIHSTEHDTST
jgi:hypothetical protein